MALKSLILKLANKLNCGVGDSVSLRVTTISKLTSSGSTSSYSDVPAVITAVAINDDGTFCYSFSYDNSVLLNPCVGLVSQDVSTVYCGVAGQCCTSPCDPCSCVSSPCIPAANTCGG